MKNKKISILVLFLILIISFYTIDVIIKQARSNNMLNQKKIDDNEPDNNIDQNESDNNIDQNEDNNESDNNNGQNEDDKSGNNKYQNKDDNKQNEIPDVSENYIKKPNKIKGSFFEANVSQDLSDTDWEELLVEFKEMEIEYIIIGETAFKDSTNGKWYTFYPSQIAGTTMHYNSVEKILNFCKKADVKVFLSTGNDESYYSINLNRYDEFGTIYGDLKGQESFIKLVNETLPFIQEIYDLYYEEYKDIFYGWYFPPEVSNNVDWEDANRFDVGIVSLSTGLNIIIDKIESFGPDFKLMMSPYLNIDENASWVTKNPEVIAKHWEEIIKHTNFRKGDIIAPQDSMGNLKDKLVLYTTAYRNGIDKGNKGVELWSNLEMFHGYSNDITDSQYIEYGQSVYVSRLIYQIEQVSHLVDNYTSCSFIYYYSKTNSISGFYNAYKHYLDTGILDTQKPTAPTSAIASTIMIEGINYLKIDFSGMNDNFGIARANISKNDNFNTYRVSTRLQTWKLGELIGIGYPKSFFDRDFNLQNDSAIYEIEVIDTVGNIADTKFKFKVTAVNDKISIEILN